MLSHREYDKNEVSLVSKGRPSPELAIFYGPYCKGETEDKVKPFIEYTLPDNGASKSVLTYKMVQRENLPMRDAKHEILFAANKSEMRVLGQLGIEVSYSGKSAIVNTLVSDQIDLPVLSWFDSAKLNLFREIEKNASKMNVLSDSSNLKETADLTHAPKISKNNSSACNANTADSLKDPVVTHISRKRKKVGLDEVALRKHASLCKKNVTKPSRRSCDSHLAENESDPKNLSTKKLGKF